MLVDVSQPVKISCRSVADAKSATHTLGPMLHSSVSLGSDDARAWKSGEKERYRCGWSVVGELACAMGDVYSRQAKYSAREPVSQSWRPVSQIIDSAGRQRLMNQQHSARGHTLHAMPCT